MQWGDRYLADGRRGALALEHKDCGAAVRLELTCAAGHAVAGPREVRPVRRGRGRLRRGQSPRRSR